MGRARLGGGAPPRTHILYPLLSPVTGSRAHRPHVCGTPRGHQGACLRPRSHSALHGHGAAMSCVSFSLTLMSSIRSTYKSNALLSSPLLPNRLVSPSTPSDILCLSTPPPLISSICPLHPLISSICCRRPGARLCWSERWSGMPGQLSLPNLTCGRWTR